MKFKTQLFENWRAKAVAAGVIALLGVTFWRLPVAQGLSHFSYDLPFALHTEIRPEEAVIVFMDDESRTRLQQPVQGPWDRALHIQLLNELFARHAKAVVMDVLLDEPWPQKEVDERLARTIQAHGQVVLGASCQYSVENGQPIVGRLRHAVEPLGSSAPWGVAELPVDMDGTIRRQFFDEQYTNLAWQAVALGGKVPADRERPRWINYYGPAGAIPHVSYFQVLSNDVSPETISNRIVFVGIAPIINYQGSKSSDEFRTPFTRWTGANTPGVEIQATICLNLVRGESLSRLPIWLELGLLLSAALSLSFVLPQFRIGLAAACGFAGSLMVATVSIVLAANFHVWFNWGLISLVEIPAAFAWVAMSILRRQPDERSVLQAQKQSIVDPTGGDETRMHDVFISYSSLDQAAADMACAGLEAKGMRCWLAPRDVFPGSEFGEAIVSAINECKVFVVIFSTHANNSQHVRREVERAVSKKKLLVPFRIENVPPSGTMEYCLSNTQWIDAFAHPMESRVYVLVSSVSRLLNSKSKAQMQ